MNIVRFFKHFKSRVYSKLKTGQIDFRQKYAKLVKRYQNFAKYARNRDTISEFYFGPS